ncbi:hypothetical protein BDV26DRAFT_289583 [Aspergillus bertholletiae]|uniref:Tat pathway signal sequence n=1 Tax=Aspergillus bertholletiae TaxID=1226010 RepID=A0A5N7BHR3_9EURO|nr:hypothetical protein BDV26DRAFT_289583 [Aspergillus bertholletiae]
MKGLFQDIRHTVRVLVQRQQYAHVDFNASPTTPYSLLARTLPWLLQLSVFFTAFGYFVFKYQTVATDRACTSRLFSYSPVIEAGVIQYASYNIAGEFAHPSVYRGRPTNDTEAAWKELFVGIMHRPLKLYVIVLKLNPQAPGINVPREKLPLLNKSSTVSWLRTPETKGDGYVGYLEVFHQLHCLHMVRLKIYQKEYEEEFGHPARQFGPEDAAVTATHIDHCLETLRLNMMCTADVTPVMIAQDDTAPLGRHVDFNTMHKCRNFWDIREWVDQNKVVD